uniref:Uncharacterized protein n=1 Tax=Timema cristinae TaxID=61476 RepID=A0A7R9CDH9_TIMCR|nr:unnamed protein product [Timema cristinae]
MELWGLRWLLLALMTATKESSARFQGHGIPEQVEINPGANAVIVSCLNDMHAGGGGGETFLPLNSSATLRMIRDSARRVFPDKSVSAFLRNKQAVRLREHGTHTTLGHLMGSDKAGGVTPDRRYAAYFQRRNSDAIISIKDPTLRHIGWKRASNHNPSEVKDLAHGGDRARVNSLKRARGDSMYLGEGNGTYYPRERRVVIELRAARMRTIELRPTDISVEGEWETIYEKTPEYARQYSNPNISVTGKPDKV